MKILLCPHTLPQFLVFSGWLVQQNTFCVSLTLSPISSQDSIYVETRWLVYRLNNLPKVSSLPSLLAIKLVKMENIDFSNRPHVGHLIKGSCLGASYTKSVPCLVWCRYIFCRLRMCFICHVTQQNYSVEMSCIFTGILKSLVTIGILTVRGKILNQKLESYKYLLPLKN